MLCLPCASSGEYHLDLIVGYGAVPVIVPRVAGVHTLLDSFEPIHGVLRYKASPPTPALSCRSSSRLDNDKVSRAKRDVQWRN